jgi:GNAT superfamily N-acetyltransferase
VALSAIELLNDGHLLDEFDCGKPTLNDWLRTFSRSNQRYGFTRVLVVHDAKRVVGYYGLAPTVIEANAAPRSIRTGRPPDPIPCLLIGQLAVDRSYARRGIGTALVRDALSRCLTGADIVAGRAVVVRAIDADAETYWQSWGFIPSKGNPSVLIRGIEDIRHWLAESQP